jgi:hypothetical protein
LVQSTHAERGGRGSARSAIAALEVACSLGSDNAAPHDVFDALEIFAWAGEGYRMLLTVE